MDNTQPTNTTPISLEGMTTDEKSLLLYFEARSVDHGGTVCSLQMNGIDFSNAHDWAECGFIQFGRLAFNSVQKLSGPTHWVLLSDPAWSLAHKARRERHSRIYLGRKWRKTEEKKDE